MSKEMYLLIADTITAMKNDGETPECYLENVVESLADAFEGFDPNFDRVQFVTDCELAVADV